MTALTESLTLPLVRGPLRRALQLAIASLFVVGVVTVGVAFATTSKPPTLALGTARLVPGDAAVTVRRATPVAAADALLRAGDTFVVERGIAVLKTRAGEIHALAGSTVAITDGAPRVTAGDVLVLGKGFNVAMRSATAEINGLVRVRQGLSLELEVYRGGALLRTPTETHGVPRFRRAIVTGSGGPFAVTVAPLVLDAHDRWDRKFLGDALELDAVLSARSRGLTMQVAGRGAELMDRVRARTGWTQLTALPDQPIGELVVAAELARAADLGGDGMAAALQLRAEGASWGLIALEQGVREVPPAFDGLDSVVVPVLAPSVVVPLGPDAPSSPATTAPSPRPRIKVPAPPITPPGNSQPPVTVAPPPTATPSNPVSGLIDTVDGLVGGLLGS